MIGLDDPARGEVPYAFVAVEDAAAFDGEALLASLRERIAKLQNSQRRRGPRRDPAQRDGQARQADAAHDARRTREGGALAVNPDHYRTYVR